MSPAPRGTLWEANFFRPIALVGRPWHHSVFSSPIWHSAIHRRCRGFAHHQDRGATQVCRFDCSCGIGLAEQRAVLHLSVSRPLMLGNGWEVLPLVASSHPPSHMLISCPRHTWSFLRLRKDLCRGWLRGHGHSSPCCVEPLYGDSPAFLASTQPYSAFHRSHVRLATSWASENLALALPQHIGHRRLQS